MNNITKIRTEIKTQWENLLGVDNKQTEEERKNNYFQIIQQMTEDQLLEYIDKVLNFCFNNKKLICENILLIKFILLTIYYIQQNSKNSKNPKNPEQINTLYKYFRSCLIFFLDQEKSLNESANNNFITEKEKSIMNLLLKSLANNSLLFNEILEKLSKYCNENSEQKDKQKYLKYKLKYLNLKNINN